LALVHTPSLNKKWTPAEVSQILFRRHTSVDLALEDLLTEDPSKLFKFSQMKSGAASDSENSQLAKQDGSETTAKPEVDVTEDAGTDLTKLLELETVEEPKITTKSENEIVSLSPVSESSTESKKVEEDDDDIGPIRGGLSLTDPNPPTQAQIEAEVKTHRELFPEQYKDGKHTGYDITPVVNEVKAESEMQTQNAPASRDTVSRFVLFDPKSTLGVAAANTIEPPPSTSQTYADPHLEALHSIEADFGLGAACSEEGPCSLEEAFSGVCLSTEICAARDTTPLDLSRLGSDRAALLMSAK
jgi:hypothetical protein